MNYEILVSGDDTLATVDDNYEILVPGTPMHQDLKTTESRYPGNPQGRANIVEDVKDPAGVAKGIVQGSPIGMIQDITSATVGKDKSGEWIVPELPEGNPSGKVIGSATTGLFGGRAVGKFADTIVKKKVGDSIVKRSVDIAKGVADKNLKEVGKMMELPSEKLLRLIPGTENLQKTLGGYKAKVFSKFGNDKAVQRVFDDNFRKAIKAVDKNEGAGDALLKAYHNTVKQLKTGHSTIGAATGALLGGNTAN